MAFDLHQTITDRIIATLEAGEADTWQCPWHRTGGSGLPSNALTGKAYRGINILSLWCAEQMSGYSDIRPEEIHRGAVGRSATGQLGRLAERPDNIVQHVADATTVGTPGLGDHLHVHKLERVDRVVAMQADAGALGFDALRSMQRPLEVSHRALRRRDPDL